VKLFSLVLPRDLVVIETIQVVYMLSSEMKSISIWSSVNSVGARQNDCVEKTFYYFLARCCIIDITLVLLLLNGANVVGS
jgi:hypothetical protein